MPYLIGQESGGRVGVIGPPTIYGRAQGETQVLPATGRGVAANLGIPWQPELMIGTSPQAAEYQRRIGQGYLDEALSKTGNVRDALRYYHGGPDRRLWGPKTNAYADDIISRMGY